MFLSFLDKYGFNFGFFFEVEGFEWLTGVEDIWFLLLLLFFFVCSILFLSCLSFLSCNCFFWVWVVRIFIGWLDNLLVWGCLFLFEFEELVWFFRFFSNLFCWIRFFILFFFWVIRLEIFFREFLFFLLLFWWLLFLDNVFISLLVVWLVFVVWVVMIFVNVKVKGLNVGLLILFVSFFGLSFFIDNLLFFLILFFEVLEIFDLDNWINFSYIFFFLFSIFGLELFFFNFFWIKELKKVIMRGFFFIDWLE